MKRPSRSLLLLLASFVLLGSACGENPVGRLCEIGEEAETATLTILSAPALECQSRICLHLADGLSTTGAQDLCTGSCSSDDDCDKSPESPCEGGFTCMVPTTAGPFCCEKMCVCKDYVEIPESGKVPEPEACNDSDPVNACCNLSGRRDNPEYPLCK